MIVCVAGLRVTIIQSVNNLISFYYCLAGAWPGFRKGGAILEVWYNRKRSSPKFSSVLNEIESVFLSNLGDLQKNKKVFAEIWRVFLAENRWCPKKQKKRFSPKFEGLFRPKSEIRRVFLPETQVISKKIKIKIKVFTNCAWALEPNISTILVQTTASPSHLRLPNPFRGGLFSVLEQKSASKTQKTCYFAYLHLPAPP